MTPEERAAAVCSWLNLPRDDEELDLTVPDYGYDEWVSAIADAIRAAVAEERERCAKVAVLLPIIDPQASVWTAQEQAIEAYRAAIRGGTSAGGGT